MTTTLLALVLALAPPDDPADSALAMTPAVACRDIRGYRDYEALDGPDGVPALTADEKLLLYTEVLRFAARPEGDKVRTHVVQDVNLRRKGQRRIVHGREKVVDFRHEGDDPLAYVYLATTVSLKGLPPGDYEADLILRDRLAEGPPATQTIRFRVVRPRPAGGPTGAAGREPGRG